MSREVRGGIVTFVAMVYIVVLNPLIIGTVQDVNGNYLGGGQAPPALAAALGLAHAVHEVELIQEPRRRRHGPVDVAARDHRRSGSRTEGRLGSRSLRLERCPGSHSARLGSR